MKIRGYTFQRVTVDTETQAVTFEDGHRSFVSQFMLSEWYHTVDENGKLCSIAERIKDDDTIDKE